MSKFTEAVKRGLKGLAAVTTGFNCRCEECRKDFSFDTEQEAETAQHRGEVPDEGSFSWGQCECCRSTLDGERLAAHGLDEDGELVHLSVCVDCVMYLANGDEPENWEG